MALERMCAAEHMDRKDLICTAFETMLEYTQDMMFMKDENLVYPL